MGSRVMAWGGCMRSPDTVRHERIAESWNTDGPMFGPLGHRLNEGQGAPAYW